MLSRAISKYGFAFACFAQHIGAHLRHRANHLCAAPSRCALLRHRRASRASASSRKHAHHSAGGTTVNNRLIFQPPDGVCVSPYSPGVVPLTSLSTLAAHRADMDVFLYFAAHAAVRPCGGVFLAAPLLENDGHHERTKTRGNDQNGMYQQRT